MDKYIFDWSDIAFGDKKPLKQLKTVFIAAPREISSSRFTELIKQYIKTHDIIIGNSKEKYVLGYENQPQFRMFDTSSLNQIDKVNQSNSPNKIYVLNYFQRDLLTIIEKLKPAKCLFINGSWKNSFHTLPIYYTLASNHIDFELISPFCNEEEAKEYLVKVEAEVKPLIKIKPSFREDEVLSLIDKVASGSFDYIFQTGLVLAKKAGSGYKTLISTYNEVVPYQTYSMHYGSLREKNFSPPNDLNYYDAIHAEMAMLVEAQKTGVSLKGATLFINLLPCPTCARTLSQTDISEIVYKNDHSNGYAVDLLQKSGKKIRRIV